MRVAKWGAALAALALILTASAAAADPFAIIASVKGRVDVSGKSAGPQHATFGRPLERGDQVIVAPGSSATVYLSDGNVIEVGEKSTITIGGKAASKTPAGAELPGGVYSQVSKFVTSGSRATGLVAMSTMRGGEESSPIIEEPRKTDVISDRPSFRWREIPGATHYRVTLSGDAGDLWTHQLSAASMEYPSDAKPLARDGDYLWKVEAFGDQGPIRDESSVFHVVGTAVVTTVQGDLKRIADSAGPATPAGHFLAGSYLSGLGLYGEALHEFQDLSRLSPDSPAPHEALGNVYRTVGLMDLAAAEFQRALELTRTL
ncbi:MAG: hypothetical protein ACRENS_00215 [Candidatus Eiseniibacteriota bacterium]